MRVNGTHDIGPRDFPSGPNPASKPGRAGSASETGTPASRSVDSELEALIKKVKAADGVNSEAVAEAQKLLESGELDSPEAIARAAEALIRFGP